MDVRTAWTAIGVIAASLSCIPVAVGMPDGSGTSGSPAVTRARTIQIDASSRYLGSHGTGLEVTEASSSAVIESFTLLSPELTEARTVSAARGIYYAICPVGATCPYPARRLARAPASFLPRRLALELAVRTFRETTADVVAVSLPTARFVLFVIERADLAEDDLTAAARALRGDPARSPSPAFRALVDRVTRSRIFAFVALEPASSGRDSLAAVPLWPDARPMESGRIAFAAPSAPLAVGTLSLQGSLAMVSRDMACPDGLPLTTACHSRTAQGGIPGLGRVSHTYMYNGDFTRCGPGDVVILGYTTSLSVVGKGEISVSVADAPCLLADLDALNARGSFTVTGGTGIYAGASGSGRIERAASFQSGGASGTDTWIGTLVVPGLEFDLTPPVISGATNRTVKAKKGAKTARVAYQLTAQDDHDGTVPVTCSPRSGSLLRIGRTKVTCEAVDTSANTARTSFTITVKKGR